jgi:tetratricopeptide (TPR) repeat protein/tRNA A-37 threonylcarbamoyl transferase component Bud32
VVSFHASADGSGPRRAGPYRLVSELGRGGMGTVFLAERDDAEYRAKVAIKLVRPGMDTEFILARFRRERQTLARLQHPNIARLLDGGTTQDGLPYIVMEYVDGPRLTDYARTHQLGIEHRLRLFRSVCSAVDYAHRNFVVHRDLKPGNILVDASGVPKLLDFGICKLLESSGDETTDTPLTPDYASPEQWNGEAVTPLSDVYSAGIVLYELLCGNPPRRREAITPPGAVDRRLAGDLEHIILRALEAEPQHRYQSMAELAADLQRYLANEPVMARAATLRYRTGKFVRRNRWQVAAVATLVAALGVSLYQWHLARIRLELVRSLADKLVIDVHDSIRDLPGATAARQMIVAIGLQYLDAAAGAARGDARAESDLAAAYRRLGDAQGYVVGSNLGNTAGALASYRKAKDLLDRASGGIPAAHAERVVVRERTGTVLASTGQLKDAIVVFEDGARLGTELMRTAKSPALEEALATLYIESSDARRNMGNWEGALRDAENGLKLYQEIATTAELRHGLAAAYASVGMAESRLNRLPEALGHYRQGAAEMEKLVAADPGNASRRRDLMMAYGHVADVLGHPAMPNLGDPASALAAYRRAAQIGLAIYQGEPANLRAVMDYAIVLSRVATMMEDRDPQKLEVARQSLAMLETAARINSGNVAVNLYRGIVFGLEGDALRVRGDREGAHRSYLQSLQYADAAMKLGQTSALVQFLLTSRRIAENGVARGHRDEALEYARATQQAVASPSVAPRLTTPRVYAAIGFTHLAMARKKRPACG